MVICHSHLSTRLFLVRGGIPIPFMKINAASGPGLRCNLGRSMLAKPPNRKRALEYLLALGAVTMECLPGSSLPEGTAGARL
jgi:hypothetical protein